LYREVEVYDSGLVLYFPPKSKDRPQKHRIGSSSVDELVVLIKTFPLVGAGYLEDFVGRNPGSDQAKKAEPKVIEMKKRGTSIEMAALASEISRVAGVEWEKVLPTTGQICSVPTYPLPAGTINLRSDLE
jgi:hypothetical protein